MDYVFVYQDGSPVVGKCIPPTSDFTLEEAKRVVPLGLKFWVIPEEFLISQVKEFPEDSWKISEEEAGPEAGRGEYVPD